MTANAAVAGRAERPAPALVRRRSATAGPNPPSVIRPGIGARLGGRVGAPARFRTAAAVVIAAVAMTVSVVGADAGPAAADTPTCVVADCPTAATAVCALVPGGCGAGAAITGVSSQIGNAVASLAGAFMAQLVRGVADAANAVLGGVSKFMTSSTRPNVTAAAFMGADGPYHKVAQISALLMILFLLITVIQGTLSGEPGQMVARFVRAAPLAVLAIVGLPWLVDQLLSLVDAMCAWLLPTGATLTTIAKVFAADRLQSQLSGGFSSIPALLCELFAFLGGLLIYAELVVRDALVLVTVALAPLSFAAMVWPTARGAARRVGELLAAIILSKLAIWVALLVGIDLFQNQAFSPGPDAWGQMIAGSAVLAVAVFAPFVVWRLLPVAEAAVIAQGLSRQPGRAAQNSMYVANSARNMAGHLGRSSSSGGGGGGHPSQPSSQSSPLSSRSLGTPAASGSAGGGSSGPAAPAGPAGAAAGGGSAAAGGAATAGGPAAVVAVPVVAATAAKDKAASAADGQSSRGSSSGWGFQK
jgi:hypothetical protein